MLMTEKGGPLLTEQQAIEMLEVAKPLIKWMNENCHPHCQVQVDQTDVVIWEGVARQRTNEFLKD